MIEINNVTKNFEGNICAVNDLSMNIGENEVFGLVGINGAGKTTLMRMISGILCPDSGRIFVDGMEVYQNEKVKSLLYFIPDDPFFFPNSSAKTMCEYVSGVYPNFDTSRFNKLMSDFGLDRNRKVTAYSKGMKKQLAVITALCAGTKYLLCDETLDGIDPVMRQATKQLISLDMQQRGLGVIMTSHNLREIEDICVHVGLLHKGGVLLSREISGMKNDVQKYQVVFCDDAERQKAESRFDIIDKKTQGHLYIYVIRGSKEETERVLGESKTIFKEALPLTLEEIFISETEVSGYDITKIIKG